MPVGGAGGTTTVGTAALRTTRGLGRSGAALDEADGVADAVTLGSGVGAEAVLFGSGSGAGSARP